MGQTEGVLDFPNPLCKLPISGDLLKPSESLPT